MNLVHIGNLDLNLLVVADTIYRIRNVSKAAVELGLPQSAVSHALRRMRSHFDDPMFVRTTKGVAPTELARRLQSDISDVVQKAKALSARGNGFDPLTACGRIGRPPIQHEQSHDCILRFWQFPSTTQRSARQASIKPILPGAQRASLAAALPHGRSSASQTQTIHLCQTQA